MFDGADEVVAGSEPAARMEEVVPARGKRIGDSDCGVRDVHERLPGWNYQRFMYEARCCGEVLHS